MSFALVKNLACLESSNPGPLEHCHYQHFGPDNLLWGCPVHCQMLQNIPDLNPLGVSSTLPVVTTISVSRLTSVPWGAKSPGWEPLFLALTQVSEKKLEKDKEDKFQAYPDLSQVTDLLTVDWGKGSPSCSQRRQDKQPHLLPTTTPTE